MRSQIASESYGPSISQFPPDEDCRIANGTLCGCGSLLNHSHGHIEENYESIFEFEVHCK